MQFQRFNFPDELYYDFDHFWLRSESDLFVMGMDDFARVLAGEIVYAQLPEEGKALKAGKKFAAVESGKWLGKVIAPFDGELVAVNDALETNPGLINADCYGAGWMYKIKAAGSPDLSRLIHGAAAVEKWMQSEVEKHKDALKSG